MSNILNFPKEIGTMYFFRLCQNLDERYFQKARYFAEQASRKSEISHELRMPVCDEAYRWLANMEQGVAQLTKSCEDALRRGYITQTTAAHIRAYTALLAKYHEQLTNGIQRYYSGDEIETDLLAELRLAGMAEQRNAMRYASKQLCRRLRK